MKRILPHLIILTLAGAGAISGLLSSTVFELADLWFRLAPRQASGEIVIIAIDRKSLDALGPWPWPRRHHARVLDRLSEAGVHRIAFDVDFSDRTNAADDQALANAIGRAASGVILPVFRQSVAANQQVHKSPYAPFTLGVTLGAVDVMLETDGRARRYPLSDDRKGGTIPSLASLLANSQNPRNGVVFLDYGIEPASVPRLSYRDILDGKFRPEVIKGKTVIIGAMAAELGDQVPVPVHGALSGPLVHALAFESLVQGRDVYGKSALLIVVVAFLLCFSAGRLWGNLSPRIPGA